MGSGDWLKTILIKPDSTLSDMEFVHALRKRLGLNTAAMSLETRCTGDKCPYNRENLPIIPPCLVGKADTDRLLTLIEHLLGVHFDSCTYGVLDAG
jgi:hypothetical protein